MDAMGRTMNRNFLHAGLVCITLGAGALSGCVGWNVYPPEVGTSGFTNPNSQPMYQMMTESLKWAVRKYPPGGQTLPTASDVPIPPSEADAAAAVRRANGEPARIAVSLFSSMQRDLYEYAVSEIGQGAVPLTPETEHLPRYLVSRVAIRGDEAKVDVFKPVIGVGSETLYQPITVTLRGGMKYWRVTAYRVWSIGTFPPPAPEYLPGSYSTAPDDAAVPSTDPVGDTGASGSEGAPAGAGGATTIEVRPAGGGEGNGSPR
jgi:hypothetical protein